jgi:DNA-binding transcriptional MerR regulator
VGKLFRVHEFAELAGLTVKALHHYDRLGLLKPRD